jgi:hypothetical protein
MTGWKSVLRIPSIRVVSRDLAGNCGIVEKNFSIGAIGVFRYKTQSFVFVRERRDLSPMGCDEHQLHSREIRAMWRALFLSIGAFLFLLGAQCLFVQQITTKIRTEAPEAGSPFESAPTVGPPIKFNPPPWAPWSMMSSGVVICLYSFTIPKRVAGG